jgi:16S rRNA (cytosine967-C5)-methyltransferase
MSASGLADHIARQAAILDVAQGFADRGGGGLAYMTCSLFSGENSAQVAGLIARTPDWRVTVERQFDPTLGGDGFYVAILTR